MNTKALTRSFNKLAEGYFFTVIAKELKKLSDMDMKKHYRKATKNIDFDKKYWLHKAGLTTYTPVKSTMGTGLLFIIGAAVGAVAAMALAPKTGEEFRKSIKGKMAPIFKEEVGQTQAPAEA